MIEILLLLSVLALAKHTPKRKYRRYLKGIIDTELSLGTLAAKDVTLAAVGDTVKERTWLSSVKGSWSLTDFSNNAGDGSITVGIAHSDYSSAEIEAWIENTGSWDEGDLVNQEVAKRKIRMVGTFETDDLGTVSGSVLNDGKNITTKCGWILNAGQTIAIWAYNNGDSALDTTVPSVFLKGHANLWPR